MIERTDIDDRHRLLGLDRILEGYRNGNSVEAHFPASKEDIAIPSIVSHEVNKWMLRLGTRKIQRQFLALIDRCVVVPFDAELALRAAEVCLKNRLAAADAVVYATAQNLQSPLLTCASHFKDLDHVIYVANRSN